jgi:hypothetical protein
MSDTPMTPPNLIARRFTTHEHAQIEVYGRIGKIFCKMGNLSTSGAFFEIISSNYMPRQGDLVRITVNLRSIKKTHILDGEVAWCKGLGLGIQFLNADLFRKKLTVKTQTDQQNKS